ncbi:MAG TPA: hypothetical protein VJ890_21080 [Vineibacter sp.]|nr:hypothetical protein [Vineibacter sp.]
MSRAPDIVIGGEDRPYLRRWHVIPRNRWLNVYLHQFLRSDDDRALHDHPWVNVSVLLSGRYFEHTADGQRILRRPWRPWAPWRLVVRRATAAHRVELLPDGISGETPCWSLFLTGPRVREWGFHCPKGWVPWRDFTAGKHDEMIGKGCE